jgi:hypothetical protein
VNIGQEWTIVLRASRQGRGPLRTSALSSKVVLVEFFHDISWSDDVNSIGKPRHGLIADEATVRVQVQPISGNGD